MIIIIGVYQGDLIFFHVAFLYKILKMNTAF